MYNHSPATYCGRPLGPLRRCRQRWRTATRGSCGSSWNQRASPPPPLHICTSAKVYWLIDILCPCISLIVHSWSWYIASYWQYKTVFYLYLFFPPFFLRFHHEVRILEKNTMFFCFRQNLAPHPPPPPPSLDSDNIHLPFLSPSQSPLCVAGWDLPGLAWRVVKGGANITDIPKK